MRQFYKPAVMLLALLAGATAANAQPTAKLDKITTLQDAGHGLPSDATQGADGLFYAVSTFSPDTKVTLFRIRPTDHTYTAAATLDLLQTNPAPSRLVLAPDGRFYGSYVADGGGGIFRFDPRTNAGSVVRQFLFDETTFMPGINGVFPGPLTVGRDGWLYGAMNLSSADVDINEAGSLFRMDPVSGAFTTLYDFRADADGNYPAGQYPYTALVQGPNGVWYGNNLDSGTFCGNAFKFDAQARVLTSLHTFDVNAEGCSPGGFGVLPSGQLVGVTTMGNFDPADPNTTTGGVFTLDPATGALATVRMFLSSESLSLIQAGNVTVTPGGNAYVLAQDFSAGLASILRVNPVTGAVEDVQDLAGPSPEIGALTIGADARLYGVFAGTDFFGLGVLDPLPVAPAGGDSGGMTTLSATLKALGIPLPLRVIAFTLNGNLVGYGITDANGVATIDRVSLAGIPVGTYPSAIGASFTGGTRFPDASGVGLLNVIGVVTPGQMVGDGFVAEALVRYDFQFVVQEKPNGVDRGKLDLRITDVEDGRKKKVRRDDRFVSTSYTNVTFELDSPTNPQFDKATFAGAGKWNGVTGYRFEAVAQDRLAPGRHSENFKITIYSPTNQVVATVDGLVKGGKLESQRIHRGR